LNGRELGRGSLLVERVAGGAHGANQVVGAVHVDRLAEPPDMRVDRAHLDIDLVSPDRVQELLAGEHAGRVLEEMLQEPKFGRPEMYQFAVTGDLVARGIHPDAAEFENAARKGGAHPPQNGIDPGQKLLVM